MIDNENLEFVVPDTLEAGEYLVIFSVEGVGFASGFLGKFEL